MTVIDKKVRRDVIPRWRLSSASRHSLDKLPSGAPPPELELGPQEPPSELLKKFDQERKPLLAVEALSSAITRGDRETAVAASQRLKRMDLGARPSLEAQVDRILAANVSNYVLGPKKQLAPSLDGAKSQIRRYKSLVRAYPQSPLAWLDLAFAYTAIGQSEKAKSAVIAANALERDHRSVVRASSRFFVHYGDFDRALAVISRSNLLKKDPWLISAHIATAKASGKSSPLIGVGRKMFKDDRHRSDQLSELGAALATNELEHGNTRLATRIVNRALIYPTENAVAQVAWLESMGSTDFNVSNLASSVPDAWEARTFEAFENRDWLESCAQAELWLLDQPFSSRPAVHGSYVAATFLEDYEMSLRFAKAGFRANPSDTVVANNYAVSLAELGRVDEARKIFNDSLKDVAPYWRPTTKATDGLLLYREGFLDPARAAYSEALNFFRSKNDFRSGLLASIYQAREEIRVGNGDLARHIIVDALSSGGDDKGVDSEALLRLANSLRNGKLADSGVDSSFARH